MTIIFKCKMCGGDLDITAGMSICECEFCGTRQTVPSSVDEKKQNLFNRANRLRMAGEFDAASNIYESIVSEFPNEAEAYWGICLCRYGIEYVDDPVTAKKIPTCHRASFTNILDNENYSRAISLADAAAAEIYREQAEEIDSIRTAILDISSKEDPYDVFICYKETGADNHRTQDSVIAQDIYTALTDKGYKVFFSRITLESKLGSEYEPYIFSALNSSKVMLCIGTSFDNMNAVWVKNEWSRFLELMKTDKTKTLIPCYRDMNVYDMPESMRNLQGQDMSKLGFMQDLLRGIEKLIGDTSSVSESADEKDNRKRAVYESAVTLFMKDDTASIELALEKFASLGNWEDAVDRTEKCRTILESRASAKRRKTKKLIWIGSGIAGVAAVVLCVTVIIPSVKYNSAEKQFKEGNYLEASAAFQELDFKDSADRAKQCVYFEADRLLTEKKYDEASEMFSSISEYEDSEFRALKCIYDKADELRAIDYDYDEAYKIFKSLGDFEDSSDKALQCIYDKAANLIYQNKFDEAADLFSSLGDYSNSKEMINECKYNKGQYYYLNGELEKALETLQSLGDYKDAESGAMYCAYEIAEKYFNKCEYEKALIYYLMAGNVNSAQEKALKCKELADQVSW